MKAMDRLMKWTVEHQYAFRVISVAVWIFVIITNVRGYFRHDGWMAAINGFMAVVMLVTATVMGLQWRRHDALDELANHVVEQTGNSYFQNFIWLWAHDCVRTRDLRQMNEWMTHHSLASTPMDDLAPVMKPLVHILHMLDMRS